MSFYVTNSSPSLYSTGQLCINDVALGVSGQLQFAFTCKVQIRKQFGTTLCVSFSASRSAHHHFSMYPAEGAIDSESWGLSLSQFTQLRPHEQVLLLVPEGATGPDVAAATAHRLAKLIAVTVQPQGRQQLLVGLVQEDAPRHLPWCVHIFERLRLQRQVRTQFTPPHPTPPPPTPPHPTPPTPCINLTASNANCEH